MYLTTIEIQSEVQPQDKINTQYNKMAFQKKKKNFLKQ